MATKATFQGELFASVVDRFAGEHQVVATACPGLAEAVEDDAVDIDDLIGEYVGKTLARGAEVLVLGCTHYSLIRDRIIACAGDVPVIDPAPAVARQAQRIVEPGVGGPDSFLTTGDTGHFATQIDRLGLDPARVGSFAV
jgi:glutamate racemase